MEADQSSMEAFLAAKSTAMYVSMHQTTTKAIFSRCQSVVDVLGASSATKIAEFLQPLSAFTIPLVS